METAVVYTELVDRFVGTLTLAVGGTTLKSGRKFDRIMINGNVTYFIEKDTQNIYGAKSDVQYNPRRLYGDLTTVDQFDWVTATPLPNTAAEKQWAEREAEIQKNYKPRGRPRKNPVGAP